MKSILEFLIKNHIKPKTKDGDLYDVIDYISSYDKEHYVLVVVKTEEDLNKLTDGKKFWELKGVKYRFPLNLECTKEYTGIGIGPGNPDGKIFDFRIDMDYDKTNKYELIDQITAEQFNLKYFESKKWLIKNLF